MKCYKATPIAGLLLIALASPLLPVDSVQAASPTVKSSVVRSPLRTQSVDGPVAVLPVSFAPESALGELNVSSGTISFDTSTGTYSINGLLQPGVARAVPLSVVVPGIEPGETPAVFVYDFSNIYIAPGVTVTASGDGAVILTSGNTAYLGGTFALNGQPGQAGGENASGGGGAGGGVLHVFAKGDLELAGSIDVSGGSGGASSQPLGTKMGGFGGVARAGGAAGGKGSYAFAGGKGGDGGAGLPIRNGRGRIIGNAGGGGGGGGGGYAGAAGNGAVFGGAAGGVGAAGKCPAAVAGGAGGAGGVLGASAGGRGGAGGAAPNGGVGGKGNAGNAFGGGGGGGGGGGDKCVRIILPIPPGFPPIPIDVPIPAKGGAGGAGGGGGTPGQPGQPQPKANRVARAALNSTTPELTGGGGGGGAVALGSETGVLTFGGQVVSTGGLSAEDVGGTGSLLLIAGDSTRLNVLPGAQYNGQDPLTNGAEFTSSLSLSDYFPSGGGGGGGAGGPGEIIYYSDDLPCDTKVLTSSADAAICRVLEEH
ncbi:hypothetical protein [Gloeobacter kilaueensis]|uniref:Conjugal transfer protein TrbL n=1 Tax=Gloeobacter kilaueensis (strain ATCC BAA-2537 / CCAP 1431/1 / ULC 316 / JS1) TaxID=1183438 RepID=U5QDD3_GLOK1|nr:hypothetical protein [Gloeobacter kilaueensis]AGY56843.1 conjugal transfer protein TrbL [Gloeobacter kilaueensis JS1]